MARLVVHKRAARYIERMDGRIKAQLTAKLAELAATNECPLAERHRQESRRAGTGATQTCIIFFAAFAILRL